MMVSRESRKQELGEELATISVEEKKQDDLKILSQKGESVEEQTDAFNKIINRSEIIEQVPSVPLEEDLMAAAMPIQFEINDSEVKSEDVTYMQSDLVSFDQMGPDDQRDWIWAPIAKESFLQWASGADHGRAWIRQQNAESDAAMLDVVNGRHRSEGAARYAKVAFSAIIGAPFFGFYRSLRTLNNGEIHFSDNAGRQEISMGPSMYYLTGPRHTWRARIAHTSDEYINEDNITIARIPQTRIGFAVDGNSPVVLMPGRHAYNTAVFRLNSADIKEVDQPCHTFLSLNIVRVRNNELGLGFMNGNPVILLSGLHVIDRPGFNFSGLLDTKSFKKIYPNVQDGPVTEYFQHGSISIVRIPQGRIGLAYDDNQPVILNPGIYVKNSQSFSYKASYSETESYIQHDTIHLIRVNKGKLGLVWDGSSPAILPEGYYRIKSPVFKFEAIKDVSDELITHGSYTIIRIKPGTIGYALYQGKAMELMPGVHYYNDPQFQYIRSFDANSSLIQFHNLTRIIVREGEARAVWQDGRLTILERGLYSFDNPSLKVAEEAISTRNIIKQLHEINVTTSDRMPMLVTGQVTYRISNPHQMVTGIGQENLQVSLESCADAILRYQMSKADLSMISPDHHHLLASKSSTKDSENEESKSSVPIFGDHSRIEGDAYRGQLCTNVQRKLTNETRDWGIEIIDVAISDIDFRDKEVGKSLADATANTRKAEAELDLQQARNAVEMAKIRVDAQKTEITNQMQTQTLLAQKKAEADAQAYTATQKAESEAATRKIQANTEAQIRKQAADIKLYEAETQKKSAMLEAAGKMALAEVELKKLENPSYLELEKLRLLAEVSKNFSSMPTPAMVVNNGAGGPAQGDGMFFGQAGNVLNTALQIVSVNKGMSQSKSPFAPASGSPTLFGASAGSHLNPESLKNTSTLFESDEEKAEVTMQPPPAFGF